MQRDGKALSLLPAFHLHFLDLAWLEVKNGRVQKLPLKRLQDRLGNQENKILFALLSIDLALALFAEQVRPLLGLLVFILNGEDRLGLGGLETEFIQLGFGSFFRFQ